MLDDDNFQTLSDLMSAMLFVFIITLVAYIINFSANRDLTQSVGTEIVDKDLKVSSLVRAVSHRLSGYAIDHSLDLENGVISISSDRLGFPAGEHELSFMAQTAISFVEKAILSEIECKESMHFNSENATVNMLQNSIQFSWKVTLIMFRSDLETGLETILICHCFAQHL